MTHLADAHRDWHAVHGQFAVCPLDCGAGEVHDEAPEPEVGEGVKCGYCKNRHWTVGEVRTCSRLGR